MIHFTCSIIRIIGVSLWLFLDPVVGGLIVIFAEILSWVQYTDWSDELE